MKRAINIALCIFFCAVITIPFLFSDRDGGEISVAENRTLAKAPALFTHTGLNWQNGALPGQIEDWIADNSFARSAIKDWYDHFERQVLQVQFDGQYLYYDDWVWLFDDELQARAAHADLLSAEMAEFLKTKAELISETLAARGIGFAICVFPHKVELSAQNLPDTIRTVAGLSITEQMLRLLEDDPQLSVTSPYDALTAAIAAAGDDAENPVCYRAYDASHWNRYGAYLGYRATIDVASVACGMELAAFSQDDYTITPCQRQKTYRGLTYTEPDLIFELIPQRHAVCDDDTFFTSLGITLQNTWQSNHYYITDHTSLPKVLIVGDSYTWMFDLEDLAESFSELLFVNIEETVSLAALIDAFQPDAVIYAGINTPLFLQICPEPEAFLQP